MPHSHGVSRAGWGSNTTSAPSAGWLQTGPVSPTGAESTITMATQDVNTGGVSVPDTADQAQANTLPEGTALTGINNPPFQVVTYIIKT
jgi:hypothetical protein